MNLIPILSVIGLSVVSANSDTMKVLHWGTPIAGLQMAAMVEVPAGAVHCWIRNAEDREITYNSYYLCMWCNVIIEARDAKGAWHRLERTHPGERAYPNAGPDENGIVRLPAHQIISADVGGSTLISFGSYRPLRLPAPAHLGATLLVDLGDFQWPQSILQQDTIHVRVVQDLNGPGMIDQPKGPGTDSSTPISIRSPVFNLDGATTRSFLDQYHKDAEMRLKQSP